MSDEQDQHRARLQNAVAALKKLQGKLDAAERANREPIAIIGAGCRLPGDTNSPEAFWKLLQEGVDTAGVLPTDRWDVTPLLDENPYTPGKMFTRYGNYLKDVAGFDPQFFGIAPREAMSLDPQQRMLLEVSWEALENAGQAPDGLSGSRTGVFVGMSVDDYAQFHLRSGNFADIDAYTCSGAGLCFGAGRISYVLGLHGPCMNIDTACASALTAVHLACQSLRLGECDMALAGGINLILTPEVAIGMSALRALSPDGRCKAFDASADGFGRGEGCAMVTLKRVSDAVAAGDPILAVILGSAINHDGPSGGLMVPNGLAQEALLREALARAGVSPLEMQYVEAHGTGTALGDPIEVEALQAVLGKQRAKSAPLLIGSVKTNIGHMEAASGVVGLIKVALSLQNREIPPHLHFRTPSPHIPWDRMAVAVPTQRTAWPEGGSRRVAGVSAFGMSGTNVHVVVGEAPVAAARPASLERPLHLLRLSAKSPAALREMAMRLGGYLEAHEGMNFADVCYSANTGRAQFSQRLAVVAADAAEARAKLAAFASDTEAAGVFSRRAERGERPKVVFLFTGQGGQYAGMGRELHETQPAFRRALERCDELLRPELERPLLQVLFAEDGLIDETAYTQPALFAIAYSLAELWRCWGVQPAAALGHSIGEYVAACVAGMFSLEDGLKLVAARGRLMQRLPAGGAMAAVFGDAATVEAAVRPHAREVSIAAVNSPEETVISGVAARVDSLIAEFEAAGIRAKRLTVSHAFHSPLMEPMLDEFERIAAKVSYQEPRIPVISNLTGRALTAGDLRDGSYWRRHARGAVRFVTGMQALQAQGYRMFLEAGPRPSLVGLGRQILRDPGAVWLGSLRKDHADWKQMLTSLATLHLHGVAVDWKAFDREYGRRLVALPTYPFQKTRYWTKRPEAAARAAAPALHPLLQQRVPLSLREKVFVSVLAAGSPAYLRDHCVRGSVVVPATAYLEMALEAGRQVFGEGAHALEGVRFREGMVLREGVEETIQVVLTPEEPGEMRFEIRRREAGGAEDNWRLHVSGRVTAADRGGDPAGLRSIRDIRARCTEEVSPTAYYERFRRLGMEYGPQFQGLKAIYRTAGESLGLVEMAAEADPELARYHCHPALLDAALQGMAAGLPDGYAEQGLGIPVGIERYCVYERPGATVWCQAVVRENPDGSGISGDAQLLSESGMVLADVQGLRVKQIRTAAPARLEKAVYEVQWRRQELSGGTESRSWAIVGDPGGLGQKLATALVAAGDGAFVIARAEELSAVPCSGVVSLDAMERDTALGVSLGGLEVVQTLLSKAAGVRLWLVSRGAQRVGTEAAGVALAQAALWGFGAVVATEHPELGCTRVDLDPDDGEGTNWLEPMVRELRGGSREDRVAFRNGERLVARLVALKAAAAGSPQRLRQTQPGVLTGLAYEPASIPVPGEGELVIQVRATGLNFRDVLNALGLYPGESGELGDECAGTVVAEGPGVTGCKAGDEVMALASGSFGTFVRASGALTIRRPAGLRAEAAAGIPIAFLTAAYALSKVAGIRPGERVLIHAAAGGVGLAAVRIARRMGAEVFATAGNEEKREFLRSEGVAHVFDSRSTEFGVAIREITGGRGVDAVLNSLGPEFIRTSLEILAPGGRFVEIGKRYIWSAEEVAAVNAGAAYHAFQLGDAMRSEPLAVRTMLEEIVLDIAEGRLAPLPLRTFAAADVAEAFRYMAQARHTGKIVVRREQAAKFEIRAEATYLITGGLGALGLHAAKWLIARGARHLLLIGRRGPSEEAARLIGQLESAGAEVRVVAADVSVRGDMERVFAEMDASMPALRGVLHTAGVLDDGLLEQQNAARFAAVLAAKTDGAWHLDQLTRERALDFFVLYSSIVALAGTAGQSSYAAANAWLDALAQERRAQGLPALSVNWGAWASTGMAAQVSEQNRRRWSSQGIVLIEPEQGMQALEDLLANGARQAAVLPMQWDLFLAPDREQPPAPLYAEIPRGAGAAAKTVEEKAPLLQELQNEALPQKRLQRLTAFVRDRVVQVLGLAGAGAVETAQPIREMGLDSLMAVEIRNALGVPFGEPLPVSLLYDYPTIDALAGYLMQRFGGAVAEPEAMVPAARTEVERASEEEAEALLLKELESLNF